VFTWGEEFGGRLGHGSDADISRPKLVESISMIIVDFRVKCIRGSSTCKKVSLRSINFENAFLGP
jgi:hypothetical protein